MSGFYLRNFAWVPVVLTLTGCAHFIEAKAIDSFTQALQGNDLEDLRNRTTPHFEQKALRLTESLDDLKILRLPDESPSVVEVTDISKHEKNVTVRVGESNRRLLYRLIHDTDRDEWLVDDIYMKQKREGIRVTKSVTEQMDLLLTVREFLTSWNSGSRDDVLAVTTPELSTVLAAMPPAHLATLTRRVSGESSSDSKFRPEAQLDEGIAIVRLPRSAGKLIISLRLIDGAWRVDDVALDALDETNHIASLRKQASLVTTSVGFLDAFRAGDKQRLRDLCDARLFRGSILPGDLASIELPDLTIPRNDAEFRVKGTRGVLLVPTEDALVKIDMAWQGGDDPEASGRYLVDEVTLYDHEGGQQKRISAVFTAHARVELFNRAMRDGNLTLLRQLSTPQFAEQVWKKADAELLAALDVASIAAAAPKLTDTRFRGDLTELTLNDNGRQLRFVVRDWNGELGVDDVMVTDESLPESLKQRLTLMIPVRRFAAAMRHGRIEELRQTSSDEFNRLVWEHTKRVPDVGAPVPGHLSEPLTKVIETPDATLLRLGDKTRGALVKLIRKKNGRWAVDDVTVAAGTDLSQQIALRKALRVQVAMGPNSASQPRSVSSALPAVSPTEIRQPSPRTIAAPPVPQTSPRVNPVSDEVALRRVTDPASSPIAIPFE